MRLIGFHIATGCAVILFMCASTLAQSDSSATHVEDRIARLAQKADTSKEQPRQGRRIGPAPGQAPSADPPVKDAGDGDWLLSTLTSLGIVLGLILLLRWGWIRMGGRVTAGPSPAVELLSRTSVAPKNHIVLVRVGGRVLVCGDSPTGLRTLANVDDPEEVAQLLSAVSSARENSVSRSFSQLLNRSHREYDRAAEGEDDREHHLDRARESVSNLLSRVRALTGRGGAA